MAITTAAARTQLLDVLAGAADQIGVGLAYLGEAYEQFDEYAAERLEEELFRPVQSAYGRAKRTHGEFAERHALPRRTFEAQHPHVRANNARGVLQSAVEAVAQADSALAALQDSLLPVEVGDAALRAGLEAVRVLLGEVPERARQLARTLGR